MSDGRIYSIAVFESGLIILKSRFIFAMVESVRIIVLFVEEFEFEFEFEFNVLCVHQMESTK